MEGNDANEDEAAAAAAAATAVKDSAKEIILTSFQDVTAHVGLSSIVETLNVIQAEEGGTGDVDLGVGHTFTLVTDNEIAETVNDSGNDDMNCCCCCCRTKLKNFLVIVAGCCIFPVVQMFILLLDYAVKGINMWSELLALPFPVWTSYCEQFPLPKCQGLSGNTMVVGQADTSTDTSGGLPSFQVVIDRYTDVNGLFGIISGITVVVINYRLTAIIGGSISAFACFISFFMPLKPRLLAFVLGALPGIGNNLVITSLTVAILEYFRDRSVPVLSTVIMSQTFAVAALAVGQFYIFPPAHITMYNWEPLFLYQAATYVICIAGAMALKPLNLHMKDDPGQTARGRILNIRNLHILKSPTVYCLSAIFLFDGLGAVTPKTYMQNASDPPPNLVEIFPSIFSCGESFGALISCILSIKKLSLSTYLVVIAACEFFMGALTFTVEAFFVEYIYAFVYSGLLGMLTGIVKPLLQACVPLVMGEDNLGLAVGITTFATGVGSIVGRTSSGAIIEDHHSVDGAFYMAASSFVVASAVSLLLTRLSLKANTKISVSQTVEKEEESTTRPGG